MLVSPIRIFATLAVAAVGVSAQSACIITCLTQSVSPSTCPTYTDLTCVCTNTAFQQTAAACLQANCTTADQQSAQQLEQAECGTSSNSTTNSTSPSSSSKTPASSSSTPSPSSTSKNGAVYEQVPFLNGAIALATVALGGALFL